MSPLLLAFIAFGAVVAVEIYLTATWNRVYMTIGIPIFIRRVDRPTGLADLDLEVLAAGTKTAAAPPLLFRRVSPDVIVFREPMSAGGIDYFPIMHGVIRRAPGEPTVAVIGLAKWWVVAMLVVFIILFRFEVRYAMPWIGGALAILYFIQFVRYRRVGRALS